MQPADSVGDRRFPLSVILPIALLATLFVLFAYLAVNHYLTLGNPMSSPVIRYIVPIEFRGAFVIIVANTTTSQSKRVESNVYDIEVPRSGRVYVANDDTLLQWHREIAVLSDGRRLPLGVELAEDDLTTIALWSLYTDGGGNTWNYVGTRSEMKNALTRVRLTPGEPVGNVRAQEGEEAFARPGP